MTAPYIPRPRTLEEALRAAFMPPIAADATATPPVRPDFSGVPMATMRATSAPMPRGPRESGNPAADRLNARVDRGLAMLGRQAAPSADTPEGWLREMFNPVAVGRGTREMANATGAQMRRAGRTGNVGDAAMAAGLGGLTLASAIPGGPADDAARVVAGQSDDVARGIRAYHGTPHRFAPEPGHPLGRFRMDKLGTGEGAQAYGHGLYFAEAPDVASGYKKNLTYKQIRDSFLEEIPQDADFDEVMSLVGKGHFTPYQEQVLKALADDDWLGFDYPSQAITAAYKELDNFDPSQQLRDALKNDGAMYEVAIDASPDELLDWDAPLSQQPEKVLQRLGFERSREAGEQAYEQLWAEAQAAGKNLSDEPFKSRYDALNARLDRTVGTTGVPDVTGAEFYRSQNDLLFGSANEFKDLMRGRSEWLREQGIPGLRYLDGNSRGVGQGTRNYVIWDESKIRILKALAAAGMVSPAALASAEAAYAQQQQERP